jgi:hypothetical protein
MQDDQTYFERRAAQERSAASAATDAKVRSAHQELAEHYQALARSAGDAQGETKADTAA